MRFILLLFVILSFSLPAWPKDGQKETIWEKLVSYHALIDSLVKGSLDSRGMTWDTLFRPNLSTWPVIAQNIDKELSHSVCSETDCTNYEQDFAKMTNSPLSSADHFEIMENKRSFELRKELFLNAKSSIHVLVWAIYDDETGEEFEELMYEALRRNPEIDIRIIVDGNIANMKGRKLLKRIERVSLGMIKVIRWKSKKYRANGNHRKMIIVDKEHVVVGGMNVGNSYSHLVAGGVHWRDLDIYIKGGEAGQSAYNQFAEIWNKQLSEFRRLRK